MLDIVMKQSLNMPAVIHVPGRRCISLILVNVLFKERTGRLAKWLAQNTKLVMVLADIVNSTLFISEDVEAEALSALLVLVAANVSKIPYLLGLGF